MFRYPDKIPVPGERVLTFGNWPYARLRLGREVRDHQLLFLTKHTIVMGVSGEKLLHFNDETVSVHPTRCVVMKRGIYAMSELLPDQAPYEALLMFFNDNILRSFLSQQQLHPGATLDAGPDHIVLNNTPLLTAFREQYLQFFSNETTEPLLQLKIQELFLLMLAGSQRHAVLPFLQSIVYAQPLDLTYIVNTHLFRPLTLEELAKLSGRSLASFKRDFQQQFNCAPKKWINTQRLAHAQTLLQHSGKNVSEVAMECGFENVPHFIRIFKQEFGVTPNSVRAKKAMI
jgi:AraC family transcriptional regulator, exoenzyme S synthesis regulatory protein ExsA